MDLSTVARPHVSTERYRELEVLAMSLMLQLPHHDLGECLIISDIGMNILRRWVENERMASHEIKARKGFTLVAESGGSISYLPSSSD